MKKVYTSIVTDWSEIDAIGHVNNLSIMKYAQAGRVHFLSEVGYKRVTSSMHGAILRKITSDFRRQLYFPGKVRVSSYVIAIGNTSFSLRHEIENEAGELAAVCEDVLVCFDYTENKTQPIGDALRAQLAEYIEEQG